MRLVPIIAIARLLCYVTCRIGTRRCDRSTINTTWYSSANHRSRQRERLCQAHGRWRQSGHAALPA